MIVAAAFGGTRGIEFGDAEGGENAGCPFGIAATGGEPAISFLKGNDNVLFLLDRNDQLLVRSTHCNYTLDRRRR